MIIAAAREIQNGEVVFVGMRLPIMAYAVARLTHAPDAVGFFECGVMRHHPARSLLYTMGRPGQSESSCLADRHPAADGVAASRQGRCRFYRWCPD